MLWRDKTHISIFATKSCSLLYDFSFKIRVRISKQAKKQLGKYSSHLSGIVYASQNLIFDINQIYALKLDKHCHFIGAITHGKIDNN